MEFVKIPGDVYVAIARPVIAENYHAYYATTSWICFAKFTRVVVRTSTSLKLYRSSLVSVWGDFGSGLAADIEVNAKSVHSG